MHNRTLNPGQCYCGSASNYSDCCGALHRGDSHAQNAEQLMRSRYSACCLELVDYLLATTHATTKSRYNRAELTHWLQQNNWCSLQVVSTTDNGSASEYVDFVAYYQQGAKLLQHREYSQFKRETDQRWYFVGGEHRPDITVERNQSCPCGSAIKHKKCCL